MKTLSELEVYCITDKNGNVVFPFAREDIPFGRFHAESDLHAWAVKRAKKIIKKLPEKVYLGFTDGEPVIYSKYVASFETSINVGRLIELIDAFKLTEEELK